MFNKQILVVEDSVPWQRLVLTILQAEPDLAIASMVSSGFEAVEKARELKPDVILMDVGLPGISGFEATRLIFVLSPASKVLFLSEHNGADFVLAAFEAGGSGYVLKSDSHTDLLPAVRAILSGHQFISRSLASPHKNPGRFN